MCQIIAYFISQDELYREGFKRVLEITIPQLNVKTFNHVPIVESDVSLVIFEPIFYGEQRNLEEIARLTKSDHTRICVLLESNDENELLEVLSYKVHGVLYKSKSTLEIVNGIKRVIKVGHYIPSDVGKVLLDEYQHKEW